ncbi:unnamed protein product [Kuraishia capsulata CBS 1993]|uniref:ADF-H domain-containing protein n=1 Tax=Kuraishia capsulata CBS 1993 TaxID=1382522 RepID=W6MS10_9ASCO|nr:uncharacterized protein KUCA_T00005170001 [Kuraishia capsulata CBS 1993]CDK29183.1 unnamed protein product [Kuraishia capsulata CBS 1993]
MRLKASLNMSFKLSLNGRVCGISQHFGIFWENLAESKKSVEMSLTMSSTLYSFNDETLSKLRKFRFASARASTMQALVYQIDKKTYEIKTDDEIITSLEELVEEIPDNTPRYIVLSYPIKTKDGLTKSPLLLIYYRPQTSTQDMKMLYAGAVELIREKAGVSK